MIKAILMVAGPSGSGKSTLINILVEAWPNDMAKVQSLTTRPKRSESDDEHLFVDQATFDLMRRTGQLAEEDDHNGYSYGVTWDQIHEIWKQNKLPVMALNLAGVNNWIEQARRGKFEWRAIYMRTTPDTIVQRLADRLIEIGERTLELPKADTVRLLEAIKQEGEFAYSWHLGTASDDRPIVSHTGADNRIYHFSSEVPPGSEHIYRKEGAALGYDHLLDVGIVPLD
jgi:guanylate kinase